MALQCPLVVSSSLVFVLFGITIKNNNDVTKDDYMVTECKASQLANIPNVNAEHGRHGNIVIL